MDLALQYACSDAKKSIRFLRRVHNFCKFYTYFRLMISWLYCVLLLQKLLIFAEKKKEEKRLKCRNCSAVILWWQERCTSMQVYSYLTHNCLETIFKTGLKEITRTTERSCCLTNLLGLHAGSVEGCRDLAAAAEARGERGAEHRIGFPVHSARVSD